MIYKIYIMFEFLIKKKMVTMCFPYLLIAVKQNHGEPFVENVQSLYLNVCKKTRESVFAVIGYILN